MQTTILRYGGIGVAHCIYLSCHMPRVRGIGWHEITLLLHQKSVASQNNNKMRFKVKKLIDLVRSDEIFTIFNSNTVQRVEVIVVNSS